MIRDFNRKEFINRIYKFVQSNQELFLKGVIDIDVAVTKNIVGSGRKKTFSAPKDSSQNSLRKHSVIRIVNSGK